MPNPSSSASHRGWIVPALLLFAVAWLLTFNAAYLNGDDVLPLAKAELRNAFVPNFKTSWVPNRLVDSYGRDLLAAGFDLWFFALRTVVPVDFFLLYKAYSATAYAAFLTMVVCYMRRPAMAGSARTGAVADAVTWCFLAALVLGLFPWRNQTHFVAYQLPAFLCFMLLNEVAQRLVVLVRSEGRSDAAAPSATDRYPSLILLAFVCAFSLEAYAATVLASLLLPAVLVTRALLRSRRTAGPHDAGEAGLAPLALVLDVAIVFCAIAIAATLAFSERADVAPADAANDLSLLRQVADAWIFSRRGVIAVLLCAIPLAVAAALRGRRSAVAVPTQRMRDPRTWIYACALAVVVLASVAVTALVSIMARVDYFATATYPWGAFLLVAKLFAIQTAIVLALRIAGRRVAARSACLVLGFIVASKCALDVIGSARASHATSKRLAAIYTTLGDAGGPVTETGLALASIPMVVRPLPTAESPEWFVAAYGRLFAKYYGVTTRPTFR